MPSCGVNNDLHHLSEDLLSQVFSEDIENQFGENLFDENKFDENQFDESGTNSSDVGKDHYSNQLPATISNSNPEAETKNGDNDVTGI